MVGGGQRLLPEILGQTDPVGANTPIFNRYSPPPVLCENLAETDQTP